MGLDMKSDQKSLTIVLNSNIYIKVARGSKSQLARMGKEKFAPHSNHGKHGKIIPVFSFPCFPWL